MKNIIIYMITAGTALVLLQSCGPGEEELRQQERAQEQVRLDSLERVWEAEMEQMRLDSIQQAQQESPSDLEDLSEVSEDEPAAVIRYDPAGRFAVQVRSWRSEEMAREHVEEWNQRGFEQAYIEQYGDESTGDVWFRVRIGNIGSHAMAARLQEKLKNEYRTESWIANTTENN